VPGSFNGKKGMIMSEYAQEEAISICRDLIRIDTTNRDGSGEEREAAEYVAEKLEDVGLKCDIFEPEQGRTSVVTRIDGTNPSANALLLHGHLDVVPADPSGWDVHPFSGEIRDNFLWGRGAIDMKNMDAVIISVVRDLLRSGRRPERDLVLAFVADEEAGGTLGAKWLVETRPDLFDGCTDAIGEVGGFSYSVSPTKTAYLVETAQKGMAWMHLTATGRSGHGSAARTDNPITKLAEAIARVANHTFPVVITPTMVRFFEEMGITVDPDHPSSSLSKLGPISGLIESAIRDTANATAIVGGDKINVIPARAKAKIDGRFLPGRQQDFLSEIDELLGPDIEREWFVFNEAIETDPSAALFKDIEEALRVEDPSAHVVPYLLSAGTDAKYFARLGMRCFGFCPLQLPVDLDFWSMFHGVNERIPLDTLRFAVRVMARLLGGGSPD
jgi:acetylornithine deacetylase/succinyl-diaminopimelate desuccinylase-like protein